MRSLTLLLLVVLVVVFCVSHQGFVSAADEPKADEFLPSILLDSVVNHDLDGVHKAIENGENIDLVNPNGWSAARFAVSQNDLDMLRELIDAKIDLNNADNSGVTPLMAAAQAADKEMVEVLLAGNASPLQVSLEGSTAYDYAIRSGRQLVALMIAEAAVLHAIDGDNLLAAMENLRHGAYINLRNNAGWTPLMMAVAHGDVQTVREIIDFGADCNRTENDGWTALHFAANSGHLEIVEMLLKANVDHSIRTADGRTARDMAISEGHQEIANLIPEATHEL